MTHSSIKTTPLTQDHLNLGAKMAPFAGFSMPIHYKNGIIEEHRMVRERAGIFDVSHMGEFWLEGDEATLFLDRLVPSPISRLVDGQAQYSFLCRDDGGIIDDIIIYRETNTRYLICVNASNVDTDFAWISSQTSKYAVVLTNQSADYGLLAIQGPKARAFLKDALVLTPKYPTGPTLLDIKRFHFSRFHWTHAGTRYPLIVARTGYTGEDGVEIFTPNEALPALWAHLLTAGAPLHIGPVGLGARDSLRLEAGLPLYGHELDLDHSPVESGLSRFVDWNKTDFIGYERLHRDRASGGRERLVGLIAEAPHIPREGYVVLQNDTPSGKITSGTYAPSLERGIAMAFVTPALDQIDLDIWVEIRKKRVAARISRRPFYKS